MTSLIENKKILIAYTGFLEEMINQKNEMVNKNIVFVIK